MDLDKESVKKMFPNLTKELQTKENKVHMNSIRSTQENGEKATASQRFDHYMPGVIDFIRRCDTEKQAEEIIEYMEKRDEIDTEYALKLKEQLRQKGVRSFGSKKEHDYYLKHYRQ